MLLHQLSVRGCLGQYSMHLDCTDDDEWWELPGQLVCLGFEFWITDSIHAVHMSSILSHHLCGPVLNVCEVTADQTSRPVVVTSGELEAGLSRQECALSSVDVEVEGLTLPERSNCS